MRTYYFSDFSVLSWCNNYGVSVLFVLSRAPVFQSILYGKAPSEFSPVCLPYILFATHRGIHKRLTYKTIFHFIQNHDESELCIVDFPSWLNEFHNSFRPVYTDGRKFLIRIEVNNKAQRIRSKKNLSRKIWKSIIECGISDIDSFRCSIDATNTSIYLGTPISFLLAVSGLRDK